MPDHIPGLILKGRHGVTAHGKFWVLTSGTVGLYSPSYPRGCVLVTESGKLISNGDGPLSGPSIYTIQAHYDEMLAALAAGDFRQDDPTPIRKAPRPCRLG